MTNQEKMLAIAISKLNELLQSEKIERVQIDAEYNMTFDGTCSLDVHVVYRPEKEEGADE